MRKQKLATQCLCLSLALALSTSSPMPQANAIAQNNARTFIAEASSDANISLTNNELYLDCNSSSKKIIQTSHGQATTLQFTIHSQVDVDYYEIICSSKNVKILSPKTQKILGNNTNLTFKVQFSSSNLKEGSVSIKTKAIKNSKTVATEQGRYICVLPTNYTDYIGLNGFTELQEAHLSKQLQKKQISKAEYNKQLQNYTRKGGKFTSSLNQTSTSTKGSPKTKSSPRKTFSTSPYIVSVMGHVTWTDKDGNSHPAKNVRVMLWDGTTRPLTTVYTDTSGNYTASIYNSTAQKQYNLRAVIDTYSTKNFSVVNSTNDLYSVSSECKSVNGGSYCSFNFALGNTTDTHNAFQIHQALNMAADYTFNKSNQNNFNRITVTFPNSSQNSCCYSSSQNKIYLLPDSHCEWDVIQHEYGHYVADYIGIDNSFGGSHSSKTNMFNKIGNDNYPTLTNVDRVRWLVWSEGWATYFGISLQAASNASALDIPDVGDTWYDCYRKNLHYNLETNNGKGEDDELSIMCTLWDLFDSHNDGADVISLGETVLWNIMNEYDYTISSFPHFIDALLSSSRLTSTQKKSVGAILSEKYIAPTIVSPASDSYLYYFSLANPTIKWTRNGQSTNYKNDNFKIYFYSNSNCTNLIASSPRIVDSSTNSTVSYTLKTALWDTIKNSGYIKIYWRIGGTRERLSSSFNDNNDYIYYNSDVNYFLLQ